MSLNDDLLLKLARVLGLLGLGLLVLSAIGGVLLASRTAQRIKLFKGKTFIYHRTISLIGASLFLLHPIPMLLAHKTTSLNIVGVLLPFTAPKQTLLIGLGTLAAYALIVVTVTSLYIKKMKNTTWRILHYGTYLVLILGFVHGLLISGEFKPGEKFEFDEPEKILLLVLAGVTLLFPVWRVIAARRNRAKTIAPLLLLLAFTPSIRAQESPSPDKKLDKPQVVAGNQEVPKTQPQRKPNPISGTYLTTFNGSTIGRFLPSFGQRLNLDYALPHGHFLDLRLEYYTDGSYNFDPPGQLLRNINEPKFEGQLTYTAPITGRFSLSGAILHHENFRFSDTYWWAIVTATYTVPLLKNLTLIASGSAEHRLSGGRLFGDFSGTLDYNFARNWTLEANLHEYENLGAFDPSPTHKQEVEFALIRQLSHRQFVAISFFRHIQFDATNDQFSFVKLKYGFSF